MKFTEEMINEDEKRWNARNIVTELGYCGNYMRDRKDMKNIDIRFYAYIMRKAYYMLKEQEPVSPIRMHHTEHKQTDNYRCGKCGDDMYFEQRFCGNCGQKVKWE